MLDVQSPPAAWIDATHPPMIELRLALSQVNSICRLLKADVAPGQQIFGCAIWGYGGCLIVVPKAELDTAPADQDRVRTHETAHCNGWKHETR